MVDNGCLSDEARDKWTARKTAEVVDEKRVLPLSTDTLLCEMIHAQVNKSGILSHPCSCYFVAFVWLLPRVWLVHKIIFAGLQCCCCLHMFSYL